MNEPSTIAPVPYCDVEHREQISEWLNSRGMTGHAAEIGCAFGGFSRSVLATWKGTKYFMVDLWSPQSKEIYREKTEGVNFEGYFADCQKLAQQDPRVELIRMLSTDGATHIPDGSLDWVYIDANHSFEAVTADMWAWYPKVRPGGLFSGHDYGNDTNWPHFCEVKRAVDLWMSQKRMTFVFSRCGSWWAVKPGIPQFD